MLQNRKWAALGALMLTVIVCAAAVAIAPKPPTPAVPARPVQGQSEILSGRVICLDAGHGGTDGGAKGQSTKTWEKEINLQVTLRLAKLLEASGATVICTRTQDMEYDSNKRKDLSARMQMAKDGGAHMLVSIHMNEYRSPSVSGPQVFYRAGEEKSRLLAGVIQESLIAELSPSKERVAMAGDYYILSLPLPSVLVECGFLSNPQEAALLISDAYQQRVAQAVHDGILNYYTLNPN